MGTGSEAIKRTLYGRQRPADSGKLHQSQFDRTGFTAHQVKDSLTIPRLFLHLPCCVHPSLAHSLHALSPSTVELAQHQSFLLLSPPIHHSALYLLSWTCRLSSSPPVPQSRNNMFMRGQKSQTQDLTDCHLPPVCHAVIDMLCCSAYCRHTDMFASFQD